jgi:hypothetical protein
MGWGAAECPPPPMPTSFTQPPRSTRDEGQLQRMVSDASGLLPSLAISPPAGQEGQVEATPSTTDMSDFLLRMHGSLSIPMHGSQGAGGFTAAAAHIDDQLRAHVQMLLESAAPDFYED